MVGLLAQTDLLEWAVKGGVAAILALACYLLVRYILQTQRECKVCRGEWHEREKKWIECKADLEKEYRGKVEALLREQIAWQQDLFESDDPSDDAPPSRKRG